MDAIAHLQDSSKAFLIAIIEVATTRPSTIVERVATNARPRATAVEAAKISPVSKQHQPFIVATRASIAIMASHYLPASRFLPTTATATAVVPRPVAHYSTASGTQPITITALLTVANQSYCTGVGARQADNSPNYVGWLTFGGRLPPMLTDLRGGPGCS